MTTPAVRERPILFSSPMVRAILADKKTMTRRICDPQPVDYDFRAGDPPIRPAFVKPHLCPGYDAIGIEHEPCYLKKQPFTVGMKLWVRETGYWFEQKVYHSGGTDTNNRCVYRADGGTLLNGAKWKPSIFMPRWASRITLEVTAVRVERLADISEDDAIAEGVDRQIVRPGKMSNHVDAFAVLWDSINGKESFSGSPWVWVVSFRRLGQSAGGSK